MSDYIDRQQAIDAVGKEPYVADIDGAPTRVYRDVDVMWELYHLPSAQQWIPCSERLPKEYAEYLVCYDNGECYVYWLDDSYWSRGLIEKENIVAWMPLPDPYEVKNGKND